MAFGMQESVEPATRSGKAWHGGKRCACEEGAVRPQMLCPMAPSPVPSSAMCCQTVRQTVYGQS